MSVKPYGLRVDRSAAAWTRFETCPSGPVQIDGASFCDGMLWGLCIAELAAAQEGLVKFPPVLTTASQNVVIGGAWDHIKAGKGSKELRACYGASHRQAKRLHMSAIPAPWAKHSALLIEPTLPFPGKEKISVSAKGIEGIDAIGAWWVGAMIAVGVVGVAALAAYAWYSAEVDKRRVEVEGDHVRKAHAVGVLTDELAKARAAKVELPAEVKNAILEMGGPGVGPDSPGGISLAWPIASGALGLATGAVGSIWIPHLASGGRR